MLISILWNKQGKVGKSLFRYSKAQIKAITSVAEDLIKALGYEMCCSEDMEPTHIVLRPMQLECSSLCKGYRFCNNEDKIVEINRLKAECLEVNSHGALRDDNDRFGRKITDLRKSLTNNDKDPFEVE